MPVFLFLLFVCLFPFLLICNVLALNGLISGSFLKLSASKYIRSLCCFLQEPLPVLNLRDLKKQLLGVIRD